MTETITICNRCGVEIETFKFFSLKYNCKRKKFNLQSNDREIGNIELCKNCKESFFEWLNREED
jgi:NMD protein affecting ribosome stability and mRNA decay